MYVTILTLYSIEIQKRPPHLPPLVRLSTAVELYPFLDVLSGQRDLPVTRCSEIRVLRVRKVHCYVLRSRGCRFSGAEPWGFLASQDAPQCYLQYTTTSITILPTLPWKMPSGIVGTCVVPVSLLQRMQRSTSVSGDVIKTIHDTGIPSQIILLYRDSELWAVLTMGGSVGSVGAIFPRQTSQFNFPTRRDLKESEQSVDSTSIGSDLHMLHTYHPFKLYVSGLSFVSSNRV